VGPSSRGSGPHPPCMLNSRQKNTLQVSVCKTNIGGYFRPGARPNSGLLLASRPSATFATFALAKPVLTMLRSAAPAALRLDFLNPSQKIRVENIMMNRSLFRGWFLIALVCGAWHQGASAADTLWAEKSNWLNLIGYGQVQHTYACYRKTGQTTRYCYGNPGSNSGGTYLTNTQGSGYGVQLACAAGNKCAITWGFNGTCHQGANRMLKTANKTVSAAGGYSLSVRLFGTYGTEPSWTACRLQCRI